MDDLPLLFEDMAKRRQQESKTEISYEQALAEVKVVYQGFGPVAKSVCKEIELEMSVWNEIFGK